MTVTRFQLKEVLKLVYYKNGKYHISNLKVHYMDEHEGEVIKFVGQESKQWWIDFAENWEDTFELKRFIEVEVTDKQLKRLEKVNELNLQEGVTLIDEYVLENDLSEVKLGHPLYTIVLSLKLEEAEQKIETAESQNKITLMGLMDVNSKLRALEKEVK